MQRSEMFYKNYQWSAASERDNPKLRGEPDSSLLDRNEGYEVLYLLNKFQAKHNLSLTATQKAERMIRAHLPGNLRSQENVVRWIELNWDLYT